MAFKKKTVAEEVLNKVAEETTVEKKNLPFDDKMKKIQEAVGKKYGRGKIVKGEEVAKQSLERVPIYEPIDRILGGGIPRGRVVEIFGKPSVGKTTLSFMIIRKFQELGMNVAYIEVDNGLDLESMKKFGVDTDKLYVVTPESCEEALDTLDAFIRTREFGLVVLDCLAMLSPEEEIEGSMQDNQMALLARRLNKVLRKVHSGLQAEDLRKAETYNDVSVLFVNQVRTKLGIMFGSNESVPGGLGREYSASIRVRVSKVDFLKDTEGQVIGIKSKLETVKNKTYYPHRECIVSISHKTGKFYEAEDLLKALLDKGVFIKLKGWIKFKEKSFREDELLDMLENNEEFIKMAKELLR